MPTWVLASLVTRPLLTMPLLSGMLRHPVSWYRISANVTVFRSIGQLLCMHRDIHSCNLLHIMCIHIGHGAELPYVFHTTDLVFGDNQTHSEEVLADIMTTYWTNFAHYGDPNAPCCASSDTTSVTGQFKKQSHCEGNKCETTWPENIASKPQIRVFNTESKVSYSYAVYMYKTAFFSLLISCVYLHSSQLQHLVHLLTNTLKVRSVTSLTH